MARRTSASLPRLLPVGVFSLLGIAFAPALSAAFWQPLTPEDRALARPRVDPEAGVEILFRETEIDDSRDETTSYHSYVRLKVFDARGVAALDKIEIVETREAPIINVAARVIRPDGTIVEVDRDAIHAREILRHGSVRVKAKAFALPALEPGCIVEYQWDEESEHSIGGLQLYFQDRFPAQRVRFRIKPFNYNERGYQVFPAGFRYDIPELRADSQGFYLFEQTNAPALREESWMPPDDMVQSWMVLYFLRRGQKPDEFWKDAGRALAQEAAKQTQPTRELEDLGRTLVADATEAEEKLRRLGRFCRDEIANRTARTVSLLPDVRSPPQKLQNAASTLEARAGTAREINLLFLALARVAGFEVRLACATDRSKRIFREPLPARFMLPDTLVAVRVDGAWRFFDPGSRHVAIGNLAWKNEGVAALICDRAHSEFMQTPRTPRSASGVSRSARLVLDSAGTATGVVVVKYHGHAAVAQRQEMADLAPGQQALRVYQAEAARGEGVELGDIEILHVADAEQPLVVSYPVRVPHYAVVTESRMAFPLAFFQRGVPPVFTAASREHVVYLPYESHEDDVLELTLPSGFALEDAAAPASFALPPAVEYRAGLVPAADGGSLVFRRGMSRGGMFFPATTYRLLKQAFDDVYRQDGHSVGARRAGPGSPASGTQPP